MKSQMPSFIFQKDLFKYVTKIEVNVFNHVLSLYDNSIKSLDI